VAYSPDGCRIVSGSGDATLRVWNAVTGAPIAVWYGHEAGVMSVVYSPDGQLLASGSGGGPSRRIYLLPRSRGT